MARLLVWIPEIKGSTMLFFFSSRDSWKLRDFSSGVEKVIMSNKDSNYSVDDILKKVKYSEKAPYVSVDKVDIWEDAIIEAYNHMLSNGKLKKETDFDENKEGIETDQLDLGRKPIERTFEIFEGLRGVSYENLFRPYLIGASSIKLVDPYIRNYHQRKNFQRRLFHIPRHPDRHREFFDL